MILLIGCCLRFKILCKQYNLVPESENQTKHFLLLLDQITLFIPFEVWDVSQSFKNYLKHQEMNRSGFLKLMQMVDQELCVPSDEEADALRRQSFFEGNVLTSSNSLVADPNSANTSGDKSVLHEDVYCFQNDHFGDEEDAADMIGRVCPRQTESVPYQIFLFLQENSQDSTKVIAFKHKFYVICCFHT